MTSAQITMLVLIFVTVDAIVLYAIISACASSLGDLARDYPMNERATGPWREFQSMSVDMLNFGFCVHICADQDYVHIAPTAVLRRLGAKPMSIPRAAMREVKASIFRTAKVTLPKHTLVLPRWAAMPEQA